MKQYEKPHVHTLKNRKHKRNHQIKEHTQVDNGVHSVGYVSRPSVNSGDVTSLIATR